MTNGSQRHILNVSVILFERVVQMSDDSKAAILEKAKYLFSKDGYEATSVSRLAKEVGTAKSLIYHYFDKKEDILIQLLEEGTGDLYEMHQKMSDSVQEFSLEYMMSIIETIAEKVRNRSDIIRIMLQEFLKGAHKENHTPPYMDSFLEYLKTRSEKHCKNDEKAQMKFIIEFLFFGSMPFHMYVVFEDFFSEKYNYNKEELWNLFLELYKENYVMPLYERIK